VYVPASSAKRSGSPGKILNTMRMDENPSQKIESSIWSFDCRIFRIIIKVVRIDTTIRTTLSVGVMALPPLSEILD
jgi:hypothetical protein